MDENPPLDLNIKFMTKNGLLRSRVRSDTGREQINTTDIFDFIIKKKYQPNSNQAMFIITDVDLYPQEGWTFVFGVTRVSLRTLV